MKPIATTLRPLIWPALLATLTSMPVSHAAPLGTWWSSRIPHCLSAWTVVRAPNAVYVGGAGNNLAPGVWRFQRGRWARVFNPIDSVGAVNVIARDERGYIQAALHGITYYAGSEIQQYDPLTGSWTLRTPGNGSVYSAMQAADSLLVLAGRRPRPDTAATAGALDILLGNTRFEARLDDADYFTGLTADPYAGIYASGTYGDAAQTPDQPGLWLFDGARFAPADLPSYVSDIDAITSDGNGTIYIAGEDLNADDHVWSFRDGTLTDTGLEAIQVRTLATDGKGGIYAGGLDERHRGQVWRYRPGAEKWRSLRLTQSAYVEALDIRGSDVYAVGSDGRGIETIWIYR